MMAMATTTTVCSRVSRLSEQQKQQPASQSSPMLKHSSSRSVLFLPQQTQQTLTLGFCCCCSSSSSLPPSAPPPLSPSETAYSHLHQPQGQLAAEEDHQQQEEENEVQLLDDEVKQQSTVEEMNCSSSQFSHHHHQHYHLPKSPFPRKCSSLTSSIFTFSRYPLLLLLFLLVTLFTGTHCDTQSSPSAGEQFQQQQQQLPPIVRQPYGSSPKVALNRTLTLMQLSQLMNSNRNGGVPTRKIRQPAPMISHYQFCEEPPLVPNAISHLKRNQKHLVFPLGQVSSYMCIQGYRAVGEGIAETKCSLPDPENSSPPMASSSGNGGGGQFFFPGDSHLKSGKSAVHADDAGEAAHVVLLGSSGRSKNSKRLADSSAAEEEDLSDEEPVLNSASSPAGSRGRGSAINFPGPWRSSAGGKVGRKAADQVAEADLLTSVYDASPTAAGTGGGPGGGTGADLPLEWHSTSADSLERRKQKMEKSLRSGRPRWWPPVTLNCQPVTCADPGQVENAIRMHQPPGGNSTTASSSEGNSAFTFNSNVHYVCKDGYETTGGIPLLTCRANGQWNREPPKCRLKQCPPLPPLANGRILYSSTERRTDSRAEYHCNAGFRLNAPNSVRLCGGDDRWSSLAGVEVLEAEEEESNYRCTLIECPPPARPPGIRVLNLGKAKKTGGSGSSKNYSPGDVIIFSCDSMKTRATAKCRPDGDWSREPPHCPPVTPICGPLPHFPHGAIRVINATRAAFSCFEGFRLVGGPPVVSCSAAKGVWSDALPSCEVVGKSGSADSNSKGSQGAESPEQSKSSGQQQQHQQNSASGGGDPEKEKEQSRERSLTKTLTILLVTICLVVGGILLVAGWFVMRVRRDKMTRKRWQEYFGRYQHRQSKTHIVMSQTNNFGGGGGGGTSTAAGVQLGTNSAAGGGGASRGLLSHGHGHGHQHHRHSGHHSQANQSNHPNHHKGGSNYLLQTTSSFSSSDNETVAATSSDVKSIFTTGTGTINSDHGARTVSSYAEDGDTTAGEDVDQESTFYGDEDEEDEDVLNLDDDDLYSSSSIMRMKGLAAPTPASRQRNSAAANQQQQLQVNTFDSTASAEMTPIIQLHSPKPNSSPPTLSKVEHIYSNVPPQPFFLLQPAPQASPAQANPQSSKRKATNPVPVTEL